MNFLDRVKGFFVEERQPGQGMYTAEGEPGAVLVALRGVIDPEIGRDVVSLGMVRSVVIEAGVAHVGLAPTTAGCPLTGWLSDACDEAVAGIGLRGDVTIVTDPPWSPDDMEPSG